MRSLGYAAFAVLALLLVGVFAVGIYATVHDANTDMPEASARKAECRKAIQRYFELSGTPAGEIDAAMARVPIEDIEQCGAANPEVVTCMLGAADVTAYHKCVPAVPAGS